MGLKDRVLRSTNVLVFLCCIVKYRFLCCRCRLYDVSLAAIGSSPIRDDQWKTYVFAAGKLYMFQIHGLSFLSE